ncbi:hypothetical protein SDC9_68179 [bioreactor metagenome]|uniref:Uncharacterized protein n=1 Tax=bioreactor metagenome TaxID=1076179 RepID=A0A644Y6C7_9ZZZZ
MASGDGRRRMPEVFPSIKSESEAEKLARVQTTLARFFEVENEIA